MYRNSEKYKEYLLSDKHKEYMRKYQREWARNLPEEKKRVIANRNKDRKAKLKLWAVELLGGKCIKCGYDKYYGALDFHHVRPGIRISRIIQGRKADFLEELKKCVLLCANCHREEHA